MAGSALIILHGAAIDAWRQMLEDVHCQELFGIKLWYERLGQAQAGGLVLLGTLTKA